MNVHGYEVPPSIIEAIREKMKALGTFTAGELALYAVEKGAPEYRQHKGFKEPVAHRIIDRIFQKARKAGEITFKNKKWTWVGG